MIIKDVGYTEDAPRTRKARFEMFHDLNDVLMDSINHQKDTFSKKDD